MFYLILEKFVAKNKNLHTTLATTAGSNLKKVAYIKFWLQKASTNYQLQHFSFFKIFLFSLNSATL